MSHFTLYSFLFLVRAWFSQLLSHSTWRAWAIVVILLRLLYLCPHPYLHLPTIYILLSKNLHKNLVMRLDTIVHRRVVGTNRCIWIYFTGNRLCLLTFNCMFTVCQVFCQAFFLTERHICFYPHLRICLLIWEREREKHRLVASHMCPKQGSNPKPRIIPWPENNPETF